MATFNQKFRSPQEYANDPTMRALSGIGNGHLSDLYSLDPANDTLDDFLTKLTGGDAAHLSPQVRAEARRMGLDSRLASHILMVRNQNRASLEAANVATQKAAGTPDNTTMGQPGGFSYRTPAPTPATGMTLDPATGNLMSRESYNVQYGMGQPKGVRSGQGSGTYGAVPRGPAPVPAFRQGFSNRGMTGRSYKTFMGGR